ncbi:ABC transporter [Mesorhizobium ventifaucium]|nr:ABC transporter [Mesorhizobium ventifaucium]
MSRMLIVMVATLAVTSLSGCANGWIGKGKGKAPPPEPAAVEEPVIK